MRSAVFLTFTFALAVVANGADRQLPAFSSVRVCSPFNVLIAPSKGATYSLTVEGEASVAPVVESAVTSGVLSVSSKGSFSTQQPIPVLVRLPADKLTGVTVSSAAGIVVAVGKGFSVSSVTGILQGAARLVFTSLKADTLKLVNSGTGDLAFAGSVGSATVQADGTGTTYVSGVANRVAVEGDGTSEILINSPSDSLKILGTVGGIASLHYNRGQCSVQSSGLGEACLRRSSLRAPSIKTVWSCGLQLSGTFGCSTSGSSSSSSTSGNGNSFSSSSSSGGNSFSSSSSNGGSVSSNSFPGGDGASTLTTNTGKLTTTRCRASAGALKMTR